MEFISEGQKEKASNWITFCVCENNQTGKAFNGFDTRETHSNSLTAEGCAWCEDSVFPCTPFYFVGRWVWEDTYLIGKHKVERRPKYAAIASIVAEEFFS